MRFEHKFLIIALLAFTLGVPVAATNQRRNHVAAQVVPVAKPVAPKPASATPAPVAVAAVVPQPAPIPPPVAPVGCEAYRSILAQYDWNVNTALAVMQAESGCRPAVVSSTCDHGLMQINCIHSDLVGGDLSKLNDPATNIRIAYSLYRERGWLPWTAYTSGAYLKYL